MTVKHNYKTKMRIGVVFCLIFALFFPAIARANQREFKLRVGYWNNYGISKDANGELYGYTNDYINAVAKINGWIVEYIECDWEEGLTLLEQGKIDLFGPLQKTQNRTEIYDFTELAFGNEYGAIYVNADNRDVFYNDPNSINGKTVGTVMDNFYIDSLRTYCRLNDITVIYKYYENSNDMQEALNDGRVDMMLVGGLMFVPDAKVGIRFSSQPFYYATTKGNAKVLDGLNYALNKIKNENFYYDAQLMEKYFEKSAISRPAFTYYERDYIQEHETLNVVYHKDWQPFEYYDAQADKYVGVSVDVLERVSEFTGIKFNFIDAASYDEALLMTGQGKADIVLGMINSKPMRQKYRLKASVAYANPSMVFMGRRGGAAADLEGQYIAVNENSIGTQLRLQQEFPNIHIKTYPKTNMCLDAVLSGDAAYAVFDTYAASDALRGSQYNEIAMVSVLTGDIPVCFGIAGKADQALLSILDKAVRSITNAEMGEILYKHTVGVPYRPSASEVIKQNVVLISVLLLVFISLFSALFLSLTSAKNKELNKMAYYDRLTGRKNLPMFKLEMERILLFEKKRSWVLLSIDINKFKSINDIRGYDYGDKIIIHLSNCIAANLEEGEIFARENADLFVALLHYTDEATFKKRFNEIASGADIIEDSNKAIMKLILSGGLYIIRDEDKNFTTIIDRANIARKTVKDSHKSTYAVYNQTMYERLNREKQIENIMAYAMSAGEFIVFLQPKVDIATRKIVGAEALVRWQNPEEGLIPPDDFIPIFEKNGYVVNIDYFVFELVCKTIRRWIDLKAHAIPISVNLSRRHIANQNLVDELCAIAKKYNISPSFIELELTESAFTGDDIKVMTEVMQNLHDIGFVLSMDDFGSGLSSLTQLKQLPIDYLKLDKSFLSGRTEEVKEEAMFRNVVNLSKDMGIATVAEGVETEEQYTLLKKTGCDIAQGYLFARPMSIPDFEKLFIFK